MTGTIQTSIITAVFASFLATLFIYLRHGLEVERGRAAFEIAALWLAVLLFEFYVFGPASFIYWDDEGEYFVPIANYLNEFHLGGKFVHGISGGVDRYAMAGSGGEIFAPFTLMMAVLPTWLAILGNKIVVSGIAYAGAYLLCRRGCGLDRTASGLLAALFTVSRHMFVDLSIWSGSGFSAMPMAVVLSCLINGWWRRFLGLLALGVMAGAMPPTHAVPPILVSILVGAFVLGRMSVSTVVWPAVTVVVFSLANWHEAIAALIQMAPLTARGSIAHRLDTSVLDLVVHSAQGILYSGYSTYVTAIALAVLVIRKNRLALRVASALLLVGGSHFLFKAFPWEGLGLTAVRGISADVFLSIDVVMLVAAAWALPELRAFLAGKVSMRAARLPEALVVATAVATMMNIKGTHAQGLFFDGGQSQYYGMANLKRAAWAPDAPFRVTTLRLHRPEPNIPSGFYGLDAIDGSVNLCPTQLSQYWSQGVLRTPQKGLGFIYLNFNYDYFWCCNQHYDIEAQVDLEMLRIANVGYIVSPVPLKGKVELVSGPAEAPLMLLNSFDDKVRNFKQRVSYVFNPTNPYVYSIGVPVPRVFAASRLVVVPPDIADERFLGEVRAHAPDRAAVVRAPVPAAPRNAIGRATITSFRVVRDGYDIDVEAPDGGIVIANVTALPFWKARADGTPVPVLSANMIHSAALIPPGTKVVTFRYERPGFFEFMHNNFRQK